MAVITTHHRWDKNNFDGNDNLTWLRTAAAVLEDMRTDLLAFGIQVHSADAAVAALLQYCGLVFLC